MMNERRSDWRTIVLALGASGSALLIFAVVALMVGLSAMDSPGRPLSVSNRTPLEIAILASAMLVIGAVFLPGAFYSFRRLSRQEVPPANPKVLKAWQVAVIILLWLGAAFAAQRLITQPIAEWATPVLYASAIALPVYFFVRLAMGGLETGSRQRLWGVLAAGIALGTTLSIIAELLLALLGVIGIGIYVAVHPEQMAALKQLTDNLTNANGIEQVLNTAGPWLNNPIAVTIALLFFSGFSPVIEETAKSLATWTVFDHLTSPAQGFAVGALSGAAFGLVESLLVSAMPDASWTTTLLVRGASTMMHIMSASLTGWGIASYRVSKRPGKMIGAYALAMSLHGLWNACVVAITFGGLRTALSGSRDVLGMALVYAGAAGRVLLCLAIPLTLGSINWRFRRRAAADNIPGPALESLRVPEPLLVAANEDLGDTEPTKKES